MKKVIKNCNHLNPLCKDFTEIDGNILPKIFLHFFFVSLRLCEKFFHDKLLKSFFISDQANIILL